MESLTQLKTVKITLNIFAVHVILLEPKNVSNQEINSNGKKKVALLLLVSPVFVPLCIGQSAMYF